MFQHHQMYVSHIKLQVCSVNNQTQFGYSCLYQSTLPLWVGHAFACLGWLCCPFCLCVCILSMTWLPVCPHSAGLSHFRFMILWRRTQDYTRTPPPIGKSITHCVSLKCSQFVMISRDQGIVLWDHHMVSSLHHLPMFTYMRLATRDIQPR